MNRQQRPRGERRGRHFRVEAMPRQSPDLHKLAQVFLGMAVARADDHADPSGQDAPRPQAEPTPEDGPEVE